MTAIKCFTMAAAALALDGCVNFRMQSHADDINRGDLKDVSVTAKSFEGIQPKIDRTSPTTGLFSLVCQGTYEVTREDVQNGKRSGDNTLTIGMCPGFFALSDEIDGTHYSKWPMLGVMCLMKNLCVLPTLASLFYAPFDSYHYFDSYHEIGVWSDLASCGLIGCCKWRRQENWTMEEAPNLHSDVTRDYTLTDYDITINGRSYTCAAPARSVSVDIPEGAQIVTVRLTRSPSTLSSELGRFAKELVGFEMQVEVR